MRDFRKEFEDIRNSEEGKSVEELVEIYFSLRTAALQEVKALKILGQKALKRAKKIKLQNKITKAAFEPGHIVITCSNPDRAWFYIDEVRGKKGYLLKGRDITLFQLDPKITSRDGRDTKFFFIQKTTKDTPAMVGGTWRDPDPTSSLLGVLVISGINFTPLLEKTANLDKCVMAYDKEKGWIIIPDQSVWVRDWSGKKQTRSLYDMNFYDFNEVFAQVKVPLE